MPRVGGNVTDHRNTNREKVFFLYGAPKSRLGQTWLIPSRVLEPKVNPADPVCKRHCAVFHDHQILSLKIP